MKVFEVLMDYSEGDSTDIIRQTQYVTSESDTLKAVTDHFTKHCYEYEKDLIGVREVLTIVEQIPKDQP